VVKNRFVFKLKMPKPAFALNGHSAKVINGDDESPADRPASGDDYDRA
jgi:hypothetical protein